MSTDKQTEAVATVESEEKKVLSSSKMHFPKPLM